MSAPARIPPALEAAAAALRTRYAGRHSPDVVDSTLMAHYRRLSIAAKVQDFVPIFAERAARAHLEKAREGQSTANSHASVKGRGARRRPAHAPPPRVAAGPE